MMERMKVKSTDDVRTYIARPNTNGNRYTIIINHTTKEYYYRSYYIGQYGDVTDKQHIKAIKEHAKFCIENNYQEKTCVDYEYIRQA